jgi:hypothetical protein
MANIKKLKNDLLAGGLSVILPISGAMTGIATASALASCKNPTGPKTEKPTDTTCKCTDTEHLYDASNPKCCDGTDCACRIYYGEVVGLTFGGNNVKVYKGEGVTADMAEWVTKLQDAFDDPSIDAGYRAGIVNKIKEIHITKGGIATCTYYDDQILELRENLPDFVVLSILADAATDSLNVTPRPVALNKQPANAARLANVNNFPTSRQLVAFNKSQRISRARIGQVARTARMRMI